VQFDKGEAREKSRHDRLDSQMVGGRSRTRGVGSVDAAQEKRSFCQKSRGEGIPAEGNGKAREQKKWEDTESAITSPYGYGHESGIKSSSPDIPESKN